MRQAVLLKQPPRSRRQISESISLPAPIGGWNARDPLADMSPTDAIKLENWYPMTGYLMQRKGWETYATGLPDQVETLMTYNATDGTVEFYCASDEAFFDVTSAGAVGLGIGNVGGIALDGSAYLDGSPLTGIVDSKVGSIVIQVRLGAAAAQETIVGSTGAAFTVYRTATGAFTILGENAGGTGILELTSAASYSAAGTYLIQASWDLSSASGYLYIDQTSDLDSNTLTNDTIDYTVTEYSIGADADGSNAMTGDLYRGWFDPTSQLDFSTQSVRRKFVDASESSY